MAGVGVVMSCSSMYAGRGLSLRGLSLSEWVSEWVRVPFVSEDGMYCTLDFPYSTMDATMDGRMGEDRRTGQPSQSVSRTIRFTINSQPIQPVIRPP